ncbi:hypothetical protein [Porphyromonas levii]|uniref:Uncharacterized protein n=1 Tax=Porphyromonas levii TaxID=28114 RepID=A0A4Y8WS88_9PORP|nr:hypothetical protein [Porphyromonas levii]MBR8712218.1 hypothetical protein [Porphyromonas levii]MBR8714316.1 hypothetical protein [Porphyromonas levii]MBR8726857.1 hypothetical protein [Porphyromonas levii]MBR8730873.1 hypothetical protein [Porphyromonas levii]MBR8735164.1 hypothetical protein [Porphyromonas levii]
MGIINIINDECMTLVQGVDGLFLCEESWVAQRRRSYSSCSKVLDNDAANVQHESNDTECLHSKNS